MIYADVIYKRQFDTFLNENIIAEYYQNEISLLESIIEMNNEVASINEANDLVVSDKYIDADYEVKEVKDSFVKKAIQKLKELVQKFIEWCKKLAATIKGYFLKDIKGLIEEVRKDSDNLDKAKKISEVIKYSKHIGRVQKGHNDSYNVILFDGKNYVEDNFKRDKKFYDIVSTGKGTMYNILKDLNNTRSLSENTKEESKKYIKDINAVKFVADNNALPIAEYFVKFRENINGLEQFKQVLKQSAQRDIDVLTSIDKTTIKIIKKLNNLEDDGKYALNYLKNLKQDGIKAKDISTASKVVNTTLSAGKVLYNNRLKVLNRAINVYRFKS